MVQTKHWSSSEAGHKKSLRDVEWACGRRARQSSTLHCRCCPVLRSCPVCSNFDQRDKAWPHGEYPCVGEWIFILPSISAFPQFSAIINRARNGAAVLDLGCCFGQNLRLLAANGVPPQNMYASDISAELWELGFELFRDRKKMGASAKFLKADIFDQASDLRQWDGRMDIIIACQLLHLFDWEKQLVAMKRIVGFSRPGSVLIGYQRAQMRAREIVRPWGRMYFHNSETFRQIWREVESATGSRWSVEVSLVDLSEWGMEEEDFEWMPSDRKGINFHVTRLS